MWQVVVAIVVTLVIAVPAAALIGDYRRSSQSC